MFVPKAGLQFWRVKTNYYGKALFRAPGTERILGCPIYTFLLRWTVNTDALSRSTLQTFRGLSGSRLSVFSSFPVRFSAQSISFLRRVSSVKHLRQKVPGTGNMVKQSATNSMALEKRENHPSNLSEKITLEHPEECTGVCFWLSRRLQGACIIYSA